MPDSEYMQNLLVRTVDSAPALAVTRIGESANT